MDFLGYEFENLDQIDQYQKELYQVLADFVLDVDWESEVRLVCFLELLRVQTLYQNLQMFKVRDILLVSERRVFQML